MLLLLLYYVAISRGGMCIYKFELKKRTVRLPMGDEKRCCRLLAVAARLCFSSSRVSGGGGVCCCCKEIHLSDRF
jgi:hypothetical protein